MAANKDDYSIKKITPKLGGERGTRNRNGPTSSYDLVEQMEFLYVNVVKASVIRLPIAEINCLPIVEITLGNYKSSTANLPFGPGPDREWKQIFAFDKTKGDVLSVTLKDNNTVNGKQNFKLAADIPVRVQPDPKIAPRRYTFQNTEAGYHMDLHMSVWFGTQADEFYSEAWFSDASHIAANCVINTRPRLYIPPRLCYVRVTIVSGHDLIGYDRKRTPSVYVEAMIGKTDESCRSSLKTAIVSGSNPTWNQDLIFVASEPFDETVYIKLWERGDDQHDRTIGTLQKKLSEFTAVKQPGSAPVLRYDITPGKVEPAGNVRNFASTIKMKLATDQSYHVFDESNEYSSDFRAYAKGLWPGVLGKLEIGILGATNLTRMKDSPNDRNAYVVAKYGDRWARTRTVVDNSSPKWNEQCSWQVYEKSTVITLGIYDNHQLTIVNPREDDPIGKLRIPLMLLEWDKLYTCSFPILVLEKSGLKKMGEIQLAIRCVSLQSSYAFLWSHFSWILPKSHYKSPLSSYQIEQLRVSAVELHKDNLMRMEPPLMNEVVMDMLKPKNKKFSLRRMKANFERAYIVFEWLIYPFIWINANIVSTTSLQPKGYTFSFFTVVIFNAYFLVRMVGWILLGYVLYLCALEIPRLRYMNAPPPPLILVDLKLSKLESIIVDELVEEFDDTFPCKEGDIHVVKMRYDRLKQMGQNVMVLLGSFASQGERIYALWKFVDDQPACYKIVLFVLGCAPGLLVYLCWSYWTWRVCFLYILVRWLNFPCYRMDLPCGLANLYRRMPSREYLML